MSNYLQHIDNASGFSRYTTKVLGIFGDEKSPAAPSKSWRDQLSEMRAKAGPDVDDNYATGGVGAAIGYYAFRKKHPVLGAIGGYSLGRNLPAVLSHPSERGLAFCNLAVTAAAVATSLYWKTPKGKPSARGFIAGGLAAYAAIAVAGWRK